MMVNGVEKIISLHGKTYHCALDVSMRYIGGKWKTVIFLWYLRNEPQRFSELKKRIPDITEKMLSLQLKVLEKDGVVRRTVYVESPPRVEYALTDFGATMIPMLEAIARWGRNLADAEGEILER